MGVADGVPAVSGAVVVLHQARRDPRPGIAVGAAQPSTFLPMLGEVLQHHIADPGSCSKILECRAVSNNRWPHEDVAIQL
ncbi:MAG: hypothetical protein ACXWQ5_15875 [Ktedonobacterales bacterium]